MHLVCLFFLTTIGATQVISQSWENSINSNGWTPITREKVYSRRHEKFLPIPEGVETLQISDELITRIELGNDRKTIDNNLKNNDMKASDSFSKIIPHNMYHRKDNVFINDEDIDLIDELAKRKHRKAKLVANDVPSNAKGGDVQLVTRMIDHPLGETSKHEGQYQVFESQEQNDKASIDVNHQLLKEPSLYHYNVVNDTTKLVSETSTNEFTKKLLSILSGYNIRVNDVLPNYEISRQSLSSHNPSTNEFVLVPIPIRLSNRYNILNNIPLDSLLAVILSNYGYYLPSQYGFNNKYKNLYGHLASNNIHNNKPFGSYKVFADTDSSN